MTLRRACRGSDDFSFGSLLSGRRCYRLMNQADRVAILMDEFRNVIPTKCRGVQRSLDIMSIKLIKHILCEILYRVSDILPEEFLHP